MLDIKYHFFTLPSPLWSEVLALRLQVFVEEMGIPAELEVDEYDQQAIHLGAYPGKDAGKLTFPLGTLRLLLQNNQVKVGRVSVRRDYRRKGIGSEMMQQVIYYCQQHAIREIRLGAQTYITGFYEQLGFRRHGDVFDDAGIPHIEMSQIIGAG